MQGKEPPQLFSLSWTIFQMMRKSVIHGRVSALQPQVSFFVGLSSPDRLNVMRGEGFISSSHTSLGGEFLRVVGPAGGIWAHEGGHPWRATDPRTGEHQPDNWTGIAVLFSLLFGCHVSEVCSSGCPTASRRSVRQVVFKLFWRSWYFLWYLGPGLSAVVVHWVLVSALVCYVPPCWASDGLSSSSVSLLSCA